MKRTQTFNAHTERYDVSVNVSDLREAIEGKKRKVWTEKEFNKLDLQEMNKASTDVSYNTALDDILTLLDTLEK